MGKIKFKEFFGETTKIIPELLAEGYALASVADIMDIRIAGDLRNNYINTIDAIAYDKHGSIKIIRDSEYLKKICLKSRLYDEALILKDFEFNYLVGDEVLNISKGERLELKMYNSKIVNFLARDESRLDNYRYATYDIMMDKFGAVNIMGFNVEKFPSYSKLRSIGFGSLSSFSSFFGVGNFNGDFGKRFVGIRK